MPRVPRKLSRLNLYHVILRGYDSSNKYTDEELYKIISNKSNLDSLHSANRTIRNVKIKKIRELTHASNRQLSRVLGIGRGILNNVK